jgi:WD40 repeat protein
VGTLNHQTKQVNGVAFAPDGLSILTVTNDGTVRVWNTAKAALTHSLNWNIGPLTTVAFSSDGLLCAAGGKSGQIVLWDVDE